MVFVILLILVSIATVGSGAGVLNAITGGAKIVGMDALVNHTVRLKKVLKDTTLVTETDCIETMFMSPFHHPVTFTANSSIGDRQDPTCVWNFVGTEPCLPLITCPTFTVPCATSSLTITDGVYGYESFCGDNKPNQIQASNDLRDLYVTLNGSKSVNLECNVVCGRRGQKGGVVLGKKMEPKVNANCRCGMKANDNRIVGGEDAIKNEFPWLVALVEAGTRQPFCGGSIINDRFILTAGHCFKGRFLDIKNIEIIVNGHILDSTPNLGVLKVKPPPKKYTDLAELARIDAANGSSRFAAEEVFVHPLYVSETNDFDVATILLDRPIDFKAIGKAGPICLPELPLSYMRTFGKRHATIAGWGLQGLEKEGTPTILQKLVVNVFLPSECKSLYAHRVNRRMLCGGFKEGGKDSCAGDSGGPLVMEDKDKVWYQIGSVSWGDGCAKEANPGVYFRTTESGQWLRHTANRNGAVWCDVPE
ncbi:serine protease 27 [Folsomia candida]|uniref:serine protease 27 n=1 Tax=Folsomia candida TaxID=158441 RepID=UPI0016054C3D|nr:serine protease 27 [Folsomia candida]